MRLIELVYLIFTFTCLEDAIAAKPSLNAALIQHLLASRDLLLGEQLSGFVLFKQEGKKRETTNKKKQQQQQQRGASNNATKDNNNNNNTAITMENPNGQDNTNTGAVAATTNSATTTTTTPAPTTSTSSIPSSGVVLAYEEYCPFLLKQHGEVWANPPLKFPSFNAACDDFFGKIESQKLAIAQQQRYSIFLFFFFSL